MFEAEGLTFEEDHLDLSFGATQSWPRVGKNVVAQSLWLSVGDEVAGPGVQLGVSRPEPTTPDRWLSTHYHGSDQFRAVFNGEALLHGKRLSRGQFAFQEAGKPYREGVAGADAGPNESWMFLVHGQRRGARATIVLDNGSYELDESDLREVQLDRPVPEPDDPYWDGVPGGSRGVAAVATTLSPKRAATIGGSFEDRGAWRRLSPDIETTAGLIGDTISGPMIMSMHAGPGAGVVVPACTYDTEIVFAVVRGAVHTGPASYGAGDIRVQKAGAQLGVISAGPDGADLVFLIADRRVKPRPAEDDALTGRWLAWIDQVKTELTAQMKG